MELIWFSLFLSLKVAAVATLCVGVVGILLAYLLAKGTFPGKGALDLILTLPLVLPPTVTGYYLVMLLGRKGPLGSLLYEYLGVRIPFTWQAAAIASGVLALPLMVKTSRAAFEAIDPIMEKISYSLGRSRSYTFLRVSLPLARHGVMAGLILAFGRALGEFGATLMLAGNIPGVTSTMPLAIYSAYAAGKETTATVLVLIHTGVSLAVLYVAQKGEKIPWLTRG